MFFGRFGYRWPSIMCARPVVTMLWVCAWLDHGQAWVEPRRWGPGLGGVGCQTRTVRTKIWSLALWNGFGDNFGVNGPMIPPVMRCCMDTPWPDTYWRTCSNTVCRIDYPPLTLSCVLDHVVLQMLRHCCVLGLWPTTTCSVLTSMFYMFLILALSLILLAWRGWYWSFLLAGPGLYSEVSIYLGHAPNPHHTMGLGEDHSPYLQIGHRGTISVFLMRWMIL